jgi:hypothetical protein
MSSLASVPPHDDDNDLLNSANELTSEDRAARIPAVREAATKLRLELVGLGADLVNTPAGPERERVRSLAKDMTKRLVALDDWAAALKSAEWSNRPVI